jgi:predicted GTPase
MILTFTLDLANAQTDIVIIDGIELSKANAVRHACEILQAVSPDLKISATVGDFPRSRRVVQET